MLAASEPIPSTTAPSLSLRHFLYVTSADEWDETEDLGLLSQQCSQQANMCPSQCSLCSESQGTSRSSSSSVVLAPSAHKPRTSAALWGGMGGSVCIALGKYVSALILMPPWVC